MARVDRVSHQAYEASVRRRSSAASSPYPLLEEVLGRDSDLRPAIEELNGST